MKKLLRNLNLHRLEIYQIVHHLVLPKTRIGLTLLRLIRRKLKQKNI